jgi:hypothetical protein
MRCSRTLGLIGAIACAFVASGVALADSQPISTAAVGNPGGDPTSAADGSEEDWRKWAVADLAAFAKALRENYIYAAYPDPDRWHAWFDHTLTAMEAELPLVHDRAGYQAVLRHLAAVFQDAHVQVRFNPSSPIPANWPGFLARYDSGVYSITASRQVDIPDGMELSSCDDKPISWWIDSIAQYEIGLPTALEEARNAGALRLFVDRGSPLRPRPVKCTIGGQSMTPNWIPAPMAEINPIIWSWQGWRDPEVSTRLIGNDGAWVKLGYFQPTNAAQAAAFHAAIDAAPLLRTKRFIVLDVRGNGGGPYNWFMAYLRGLYGQAYADYYATARLHISGVFRLSPAYLKREEDAKSRADDFEEPADPPHEINDAIDNRRLAQAIAAGEQIFRSTPVPLPSGDTPPINPVRAQVYVLSDYGCGSACIGFIDELKQFPGVQQIGQPTSVDSRSGTAVEIELPSGQATAIVATMTRDGRIREDNQPQLPSIRFPGDIRDDKAVESWFIHEVLANN